ncbi:chemotaxis response regulator protein-glutamate methylesterase [Mangrovimicrobium sediminis]|uniref:Protein-glutamate methylesterase/protein-glutamine glutaminase n=1 Tax=Mangrovimicrobium sediminis TaxID=2562682 RepID=A0A4Z0LU56_9GAMM|nr:chemotaxis response regulator protein-glutamate methylesterase [Haliea sp. SAOS-164]TGD70840.1 chemotaxis response regulator protein-glutamate methylesterase [Haliea sp. SAOS-164]
MATRAPIRVLVVDDSALVRSLLTRMIDEAPDLEVVATAADPYMARDKIKALNPDVLTLDVEMPRMDGLTFLSNLMRLRPMPVVMVSSLTEKSADVTLQALELGAIDFVSKPKIDLSHTLEDYTEELREKIRHAASVKVERRQPPSAPPKHSADAVIAPTVGSRYRTTDKIIAIGASTGGTEAIKEVLMGMPSDAPGIVIAQHIPPGFSAAFAERLNRQTPLVVKEAEDGDQVLPGHAFVAPGDRHLLLTRNGARYVCRLNDGEPVNRHKPSVDVLFRSVLQSAGRNAVAAILTGMGADGAQGMLELLEGGLHTIAQDEQTSVVWGMPGETVRRGGACEVLPLGKIADHLLRATSRIDKVASSA